MSIDKIPGEIINYYSKHYGVKFDKENNVLKYTAGKGSEEIDTDNNKLIDTEELQIHIFSKLEAEAATNPAIAKVVEAAKKAWPHLDLTNVENKSFNFNDVPERSIDDIYKLLGLSKTATYDQMKAALVTIYRNSKFTEKLDTHSQIVAHLIKYIQTGRFANSENLPVALRGRAVDINAMRHLHVVLSRLEKEKADGNRRVHAALGVSEEVYVMKKELGLENMEKITLNDFIAALQAYREKAEATDAEVSLKMAEYVNLFLQQCVRLQAFAVFNKGAEKIDNPNEVLSRALVKNSNGDPKLLANCAEASLVGMAILRSVGVKCHLVEKGHGDKLHMFLLVGTKKEPTAVLDLYAGTVTKITTDPKEAKPGVLYLDKKRSVLVSYTKGENNKPIAKEEHIAIARTEEEEKVLLVVDKALIKVKKAYLNYLDGGSKAAVTAALKEAYAILKENQAILPKNSNIARDIFGRNGYITQIQTAMNTGKLDGLNEIHVHGETYSAPTAEGIFNALNWKDSGYLNTTRKIVDKYIFDSTHSDFATNLPNGLGAYTEDDIFNELINQGYMDPNGEIQAAFPVDDPASFSMSGLGSLTPAQVTDIFNIVNAAANEADFFGTATDTDMITYASDQTEQNYQGLPRSARYVGTVQVVSFNGCDNNGGAGGIVYEFYDAATGDLISEGVASGTGRIEFAIFYNESRLASGFVGIRRKSDRRVSYEDFFTIGGGSNIPSLTVAPDYLRGNSDFAEFTPNGVTSGRTIVLGTKTVTDIHNDDQDIPYIVSSHDSAGVWLEGGSVAFAGTKVDLGDDTWEGKITGDKIFAIAADPSDGWYYQSGSVFYRPNDFLKSLDNKGFLSSSGNVNAQVRFDVNSVEEDGGGIPQDNLYGYVTRPDGTIQLVTLTKNATQELDGDSNIISYLYDTTVQKNYSQQVGNLNDPRVTPLIIIDSTDATRTTRIADMDSSADPDYNVYGGLDIYGPVWMPGTVYMDYDDANRALTDGSDKKSQNLEIQPGFPEQTMAKVDVKGTQVIDMYTSSAQVDLQTRVPFEDRSGGMVLKYRVLDKNGTEITPPVTVTTNNTETSFDLGTTTQRYQNSSDSFLFTVTGLNVTDDNKGTDYTIEYWLEDKNGVESVRLNAIVHSYAAKTATVAVKSKDSKLGTNTVKRDELGTTYVKVISTSPINDLNMYRPVGTQWDKPMNRTEYYSQITDMPAMKAIRSVQSMVHMKKVQNPAKYLDSEKVINGVTYYVYYIPASDIWTESSERGVYNCVIKTEADTMYRASYILGDKDFINLDETPK
ncbi:hypothetical protein ACFL5G_01280 [Candidatus Margulisiibacteriota bacterium]